MRIIVDNLNKIYAENDSAVCIEFDSGVKKTLGRKKGCDIVMSIQELMTLHQTMNRFVQNLKHTYSPKVFSVSSMDEAKSIILTNEGQDSTEERWRKETPALVSMIESEWKLGEGVTVVDYGCGIGRMSKELCRLGCTVVGVDMSPEMRGLAVKYVDDGRFSVVSPEEFDKMVENGFRCDHAMTVWVLQHCLNPLEDIDRIKASLNAGGGLFVVNNKDSRAIPVVTGEWVSDGLDIWQMLARNFGDGKVLDFPEGVGIDSRNYQCGFYKKIQA